MAGPGKQLQHQQVKERQRAKAFPLSLILHDIDSPENVGGLFRLADALGLSHIYLSGSSPKPPHKRMSRAARQTERWVCHSYHPQKEQLQAKLQQQNVELLALEITEYSQDLQSYCSELELTHLGAQREFGLVLGSESSGVSEQWLSLCKAAIHIPMQGHNSSMNVVSASSIACFQLCQALRPKVEVKGNCLS